MCSINIKTKVAPNEVQMFRVSRIWSQIQEIEPFRIQLETRPEVGFTQGPKSLASHAEKKKCGIISPSPSKYIV